MFATYAYKAGSTLSQVVSDVLELLTGPGAEKVLDGDFGEVALGDWTLGAGWVDGTGKASKSGAGTGTLTQAVSIPATAGIIYRVTYDVVDWTVGGVTVTYGGASDTEKTADGSYTVDLTATTTGSLIFTPTGDTTRLGIDNVSVKPLTGVVDKTLLSASCVQANTTITSTTAAGWYVHDSDTGTSNQKVIKAYNADGTTYKYLMLDFASAGYLKLLVYESWDAGANTGTNLATLSDIAADSQQIDVTNGGTIFIGASPRYAIFWSKLSTGVYGSSTGYAPNGIFERTRAAGWDLVAAGYPPYVAGNFYRVATATQILTSANFFAPRLKGQSADVLTTAAFLFPTIEFGFVTNFRGSVPTVRCFGDDLSWKHFMHEIGLSNFTQGLKAGKIIDIYLTTKDWGAAGDIVTYDSKDYFIMTENTNVGTGTGLRIAVPNF